MPPKVTSVSGRCKNTSLKRNRQDLSQMLGSSQINNDSRLQPKYFIIREGGTIVPLIPVDMLPTDFEIHGVPRTLKIEHTTGMFNLGVFPRAVGQLKLRPFAPTNAPSVIDLTQDDLSTDDHASTRKSKRRRNELQYYTASTPIIPVARLVSPSEPGELELLTTHLDMDTEKFPPQSSKPPASRVLDLTKDTSASAHGSTAIERRSAYLKPKTVSNSEKVPQAPRQRPPTISNKKLEAETVSRMLKASRTHPHTRQVPPSQQTTHNNGGGGAKQFARCMKQVNMPKVKLCRKWCQTGKCDHNSRCRYIHEMPMTLEELGSVGLNGLPAWWRQEVGLPAQGTIDARIFSSPTAPAFGGGRHANGYTAPSTLINHPKPPRGPKFPGRR